MKLLIPEFIFLFLGLALGEFCACLVVSNRPRTKVWIGGVGGVDYVSWFLAWAMHRGGKARKQVRQAWSCQRAKAGSHSHDAGRLSGIRITLKYIHAEAIICIDI